MGQNPHPKDGQVEEASDHYIAGAGGKGDRGIITWVSLDLAAV
jgi:hypothetical protein